MTVDHDIVVAGAGCAGLSLAVHMIEAGMGGRRVLLLDPREGYSRDRTWCAFRTLNHPFARAVSHRWPRWLVHGGGRSVERGSALHPYEHIPADAFYREALARIDREPAITLELGTRVESLEDRGDHVHIRTNRGDLHARLVLDSRPPRRDGLKKLSSAEPNFLSPSLFEVGFLQCFAGWRIRAEEPCFDPGVCTMMDFGVDQRDGIHFVYVLPFSEHDALVEDTFFRAEPLPDEAYEENLAAWLARHGVERYEVIDRERGVLPMTTERIELAPSPRVIRIGLAGGLARPATGYAFLAIQRHSRTLAQRLVHGEAPAPPFPRTARTLFLDRIFLSYLARHPDRAPELFATMFERAPPDALARFLSEASSLRDDLRVMSALPALPFATEAVRSSRLWMRAR